MEKKMKMCISSVWLKVQIWRYMEFWNMVQVVCVEQIHAMNFPQKYKNLSTKSSLELLTHFSEAICGSARSSSCQQHLHFRISFSSWAVEWFCYALHRQRRDILHLSLASSISNCCSPHRPRSSSGSVVVHNLRSNSKLKLTAAASKF